MQHFVPEAIVDDRYQIVEEIGRGGFGTVYKARHVKLEKDVALKTLNLEHAEITSSSRPEFFSRFRKEALSLTRLRHGSIVNIMDFGIVGETTPFLVMDYFPGEPLLKWGEAKRPTLTQWLGVFRQVFEALGHAHEVNVVHRDVKSANVLVSGTASAPKVMLIDWGIAYSVGETRITSFGGVVGTQGAIDPENYCDPSAEYVPESDFYAVGGLLYHALCGREPFATSVAMTEAQRRAVIMANDIVPPSEHLPDIPQPLEDFLLSLLATERRHRPPCAAACIEVIDALVRGEDFLLDDVIDKYKHARTPTPGAESTPAAKLDAGDEQQRVAAMIAEFEAAKQHPSSVKKKEELAASKKRSESQLSRTVSLQPAAVGEVDAGDLPAAPSVEPTPDPAARLAQGAARFGYNAASPASPLRRSRTAALLAAGVAAVVVLVLARSSSQPTQATEQAATPVVFRAEDLEPKKDESALAKFAPPGTSQLTTLSSFSPDIKAQYPATLGGPLPPTPSAPTTTREPASSERKKPEDQFDRTMGPVGARGSDRKDEQAPRDGLVIPHNTTTSVRLLEELDTANDEPIRAELRHSLIVKGALVLPAGSIFSGRASLRYNRAQARFDMVTLPDGSEHRLVAVAVTHDGREGIDGGRLEFGEPPPDKTGEKVARAVGTLASEAVNLLPGGDALTRTAQTVAGSEIRDAATVQEEATRSRNRIIVPRKQDLSVKFQVR